MIYSVLQPFLYLRAARRNFPLSVNAEKKKMIKDIDCLFNTTYIKPTQNAKNRWATAMIYKQVNQESQMGRKLWTTKIHRHVYFIH
uniref:Uncharacterized protein n=1 Tax=Rhizophora mucronata TaxID=61149 RepID=A0A2P2JMB7_RHIMU